MYGSQLVAAETQPDGFTQASVHRMLKVNFCLNVWTKIWCRREDSNLHTLASTWT